jgi:hypothetical protein
MTRDSSKTRGFFSGSALQRGEYGKWRRRSFDGRRRFFVNKNADLLRIFYPPKYNKKSLDKNKFS